MSLVHNFSFGPMTWFFGVVEDRDDDMGLGRVRVRAFGYHSTDKGQVPTKDLPWATVIQDVTSAAQKGIGSAPVGMQVGTHVVGFFADGPDAQVPMVLGTLAGAPGGEPDTNNLARGEDLEDTIIEKKKASTITSDASSVIASGLAPVTAIQNQITELSDAVNGNLNSLRDQFAGLGIPSLSGQLNGIMDLFNQVHQAQGDIATLKSRIESQINGLRSEIDYLRNLDPESLARNMTAGVAGNIEAQVNALKNLDFSNLQSILGSVPVAIDGIQRLTKSITDLTQIQNLVAQVKGLSGSIPNLGSIRSIAENVATVNRWSEPSTPAAPQYPKNHVTETEGGHIEEFDDTPGAERYQRYHPAGTFIETHPDGSQVEKIVKDNYEITLGDKYVHIDGSVQVNIVGNSTIVVNGDATTSVTGNRVDVVNGDYTIAVGGDFGVAVGGQHTQGAGSRFQATAPRIDLN